MAKPQTYDVAVIGAGVFGAWTALHLARRGQRVVLLDAYGLANSRASSGGESRIIRMGYRSDELYTRWAMRSLAQWKGLFATLRAAAGLFLETGVLWLAGEDQAPLEEMATVLTRCQVAYETLDDAAIARRYPQFNPQGLTAGVLETSSGVLMGRRAVVAVVESAVAHGAEYRTAHIQSPQASSPGSSELEVITTSDGERITAGQFVFACGAWLGKIFPEILGSRIFPTRQEVFFFGAPPGDRQFSSPSFPTWLIFDDQTYGMPDLESRGFKIAFDSHGEDVDPDTQSRVVSGAPIERMRAYVARRFPVLQNAPIVESRVCQYENTSNGDFLIDRHPQMDNVWFAGGGSGHGFKHGPALGEYVAQQLLGGGAPEPRFSLAIKATQQNRAVY